MTTPDGQPPIDAVHRTAAASALVLLVVAPIAGAAFVLSNLLAVLTVVIGLSLAAAFAWIALTHRGPQRGVSAVVAAIAFIAVVVGFVTALAIRDALIGLAVVAVIVVAGAALARYAVGTKAQRIRGGAVEQRVAGAAERPVLLMNPKSGGGKVEQFDVVGECRKRGVEPIVLRPDDDWRQKAIDAVEAGATVLGAAGGDGTQALVATVAVEHDLPFVCIPAGTRNHFALDLGVDRDDVVGSLDAFVDGIEQRVDLGIVADRVFVNNVSLGVYGEIVQSEEYRDAKVRTTVDRLPDLLGPDGDAPELRFVGPDGAPRATHQLVLVSNNPYELRRFGGFGTRERMDTGLLGITTISVASTGRGRAADRPRSRRPARPLRRLRHVDGPGDRDRGRRAGRDRDRRRVRAPRPAGEVLDPSGLSAGPPRPARAAGLTRRGGGAGGHGDGARALGHRTRPVARDLGLIEPDASGRRRTPNRRVGPWPATSARSHDPSTSAPPTGTCTPMRAGGRDTRSTRATSAVASAGTSDGTTGGSSPVTC